MFVPRLTKPLESNKYYIKSPMGYNPCILGNVYHRDRYLNVLPNCVGYACGRFNEIGDYDKCKYNLNMNAKEIFYNAKKLGLKTGIVPQEGALIVWGNASYGHVAVVERVISETQIVVSQSGWEASVPMWTALHLKGDGNWVQGEDYKWMKNKYVLLGFVYHPEVQKDSIMKPTEMKILYNGKVYTIKDNYKADGKNYPAVRELLETIGFKVGWDGLKKAVTIENK